MLVLLVDDDPMIRYVTQALLEHQLGCETITAADGSEAVEIFRARKNEISLVLLDVSMPGINGWETLKALRALRSDVPVVLTSGYGEAQMTQENFPEQPQAFLGKPYTIAELKSVIVGVTNLHA
jgi:two-component system cell cycle sensor histidine kinase/response regulator CckA